MIQKGVKILYTNEPVLHQFSLKPLNKMEESIPGVARFALINMEGLFLSELTKMLVSGCFILQ